MLSPAWTKKLFTLLREKYGSAFEGDEQEWAEALSGIEGPAIKRGLSKCETGLIPTVSMFLDYCKPDKPVLPPGQVMGNKAWAHKLKKRYLDGETLTAMQISYAEAVVGKFR